MEAVDLLADKRESRHAECFRVGGGLILLPNLICCPLPAPKRRSANRAVQIETQIKRVAGEEGLEPSNAGIKIQCLNQLGDSPTKLLAFYRHLAATGSGARPIKSEFLTA